MRVRMAVTLSLVSCASGATLAACFDLFHSTDDVLTACQIDSAAAGCGLDAGLELCAPTARAARQQAEHACAWLGACDTPLGGDAFGPCMIEGLMAFDCTANPSHRFKGKAADLWACLGTVRSCADVDGCLFPGGREPCGSGQYTACGSPSSGRASNADVRFECQDGGLVGGENCALRGQTCSSGASGALCSGYGAGACPVTGSGCYGTSSIHWCTDGGDVGIDCSSFGTQRCSGFPTVDSGVQWVACVPEVDAGPAATCAPDASATCAGGVALSCPTGFVESLDCTALLGSPAACAASPLAPPFDWTSACTLESSPRCASDSCDAAVLTGCGRGAAFTVDCASQGLGACQLRTTDDGARAACSAP